MPKTKIALDEIVALDNLYDSVKEFEQIELLTKGGLDRTIRTAFRETVVYVLNDAALAVRLFEHLDEHPLANVPDALEALAIID